MTNAALYARHLWRNDITGLRAVAVIPVLLFHAFPNLLPGGFFGVDIFFVISGYLISGIIFRGLTNNAFTYRNFYAKRIKRILPNLILLLVAVGLLGYCFLLPDEFRNLGRHIYSSAQFIQNFRLLSEVDYFTEDALRKPLLHLWSLAIEEQFYILFPIFCALLWRLRHSHALMGTFALSITLASLVACLSIDDHNFTFYFPLTRFWELGGGILLAWAETFGAIDFSKINRSLRHSISFIGLIFIIGAMSLYSQAFVHPGPITLIPVFGAMFIIAACPDAIVNRSVLVWRPMTFVGLISYSLYLWHWPLLAFLFIVIPNASGVLAGSALIVSFLIASLVYTYIENPLRRRNTLFSLSIVKCTLILLVACMVLGYTIKQTDGFVTSEVAAVRAIGEWDAYKKLQKIKVGSSDLAVTRTADVGPILFAGDSHLAQYTSRIQHLSATHSVNVNILASGALFILDEAQTEKYRNRHMTETFYELLNDPRVKTVVIGQMWGQYLKDNHYARGLNRLKKAIDKRPNLNVYILLDAPWEPKKPNGQQGDYDPLRHFNRLSFKRSDFIVPYPKSHLWAEGNQSVIDALGNKVTVLDPTPFVCPNQTCDLLQWYRDSDHLQPSRLEKDAVWIDSVFQSQHQ